MARPAIEVVDLSKVYRVPVREPGIRAALAALVNRETKDVAAVASVSFSIQQGEIVGFLGANGAGKTTTLKMLSGLLHPSTGTANVLGFEPWRRDRDYLRQITLVMGQRNQLLWDIPVMDSFERNRAIYRIPRDVFRERVDELADLLALDELLNKPVRNLSLGERMKCEVAAALLHAPRVLYLDEPTIGLDVTMQRRLRSFIAQYNRNTGASVLLTSHYMADVEALCSRVIVIHHGRILFDGALASLVQAFTAYKTISVELERPADLSRFGEVEVREGNRYSVRVSRAEAPAVTSTLLRELEVNDLSVLDPPIEEVIENVFDGDLRPVASGPGGLTGDGT